MPETRRKAIRKWSCPHHPDGPPTLPAEGWEREELDLADAYEHEPNVLDALRRLYATGTDDAVTVGLRLGVCCLDGEWATVGYETVEVSDFTLLMEQMATSALARFADHSVLLAELRHEPIEGATVVVPIVKGD